MINPRDLPKLQKKSFNLIVYHGFRTIAPRQGYPKTIGPLMIVFRRIVVEESYLHQQFFLRLLSPGWLLTKKVAPKEICPTLDKCPRGKLTSLCTVASLKITFEENFWIIATMDACKKNESIILHHCFYKSSTINLQDWGFENTAENIAEQYETMQFKKN